VYTPLVALNPGEAVFQRLSSGTFVITNAMMQKCGLFFVFAHKGSLPLSQDFQPYAPAAPIKIR
jgi:hypothetical protein